MLLVGWVVENRYDCVCDAAESGRRIRSSGDWEEGVVIYTWQNYYSILENYKIYVLVITEGICPFIKTIFQKNDGKG